MGTEKTPNVEPNLPTQDSRGDDQNNRKSKTIQDSQMDANKILLLSV